MGILDLRVRCAVWQQVNGPCETTPRQGEGRERGEASTQCTASTSKRVYFFSPRGLPSQAKRGPAHTSLNTLELPSVGARKPAASRTKRHITSLDIQTRVAQQRANHSWRARIVTHHKSGANSHKSHLRTNFLHSNGAQSTIGFRSRFLLIWGPRSGANTPPDGSVRASKRPVLGS